MNHKQYLQDLVVKGEIGKALEGLLAAARFGCNIEENDAIQLLGQFNGLKNQKNQGIIPESTLTLRENQIRVSLLSYLKRYEPSKDFPFTPPPNIREGGDEQQDKDIPPPNTEPPAKAKLFLSYRHANSEEARKVKAFLEANGIEVLIDFERLKPGGNIRQFIIDMINESDATISLVSAKSLASAWVGEESDLTMMSELFRGQTRFIACALDTEFFKPGFTNDVLRQIVSEINRLDQEKTERKEISPLLGTSDLDSEIARYKDYMSNLDKIINRLKEFLTIDISGDNFETGLRQVVDSFD